MTQLVSVEVRALPLRGINEATCKKWGYGWGKHRGQKCQVATYCDPQGKPVGQKLRYKDKKFEVVGDLKKAGLYGRHLWRDAGKMLVVTEGEIDALSVSQAQDNKWPVVSLPNGAQSAKRVFESNVDFLEQFEKVIIMFDNDAPGKAAALEAAAVLAPGKAFIANLPLKDANEMLMAKRTKEIIDAIWSAKAYRPDGLICGDEVLKRIFDPVAYAESVPYPHTGMNEFLMGQREGELTTYVAGTGAGKTTFARESAYHILNTTEHKIGWIGLEEEVRRSALGLVSIGLNQTLHFQRPEELDVAQVTAEYNRIIGDRVVFYDHFGSLESQNLLKRMRFMVKAEGVKYIFLDHLSILVSGMDVHEDERKTIDWTMTNLASLAQETRVGITLVCHLKRTEGKPHEQGKAITLSDLRGSHAISQLSHNVVAFERDQQDNSEEARTLVRSLKCRHTGRTGVCGYLRYDAETGRLQEDGSNLFEQAQEEQS